MNTNACRIKYPFKGELGGPTNLPAKLRCDVRYWAHYDWFGWGLQQWLQNVQYTPLRNSAHTTCALVPSIVNPMWGTCILKFCVKCFTNCFFQTVPGRCARITFLCVLIVCFGVSSVPRYMEYSANMLPCCLKPRIKQPAIQHSINSWLAVKPVSGSLYYIPRSSEWC